MPGGGRKTHDFPYGKPFLLTLIEIAFVVSFIVSSASFGFKDWRSAAPTVAVVVAYLVTYSLTIGHYERTGFAVRRRRVNVTVKFPDGYPKPLLAARSLFFIGAALMLAFGIGPFGFDVARKGIIGCVFGLIGVAVLNLLLEGHYLKEGRGVEVEISTTGQNNR
jgi:hypothetical protein